MPLLHLFLNCSRTQEVDRGVLFRLLSQIGSVFSPLNCDPLPAIGIGLAQALACRRRQAKSGDTQMLEDGQTASISAAQVNEESQRPEKQQQMKFPCPFHQGLDSS